MTRLCVPASRHVHKLVHSILRCPSDFRPASIIANYSCRKYSDMYCGIIFRHLGICATGGYPGWTEILCCIVINVTTSPKPFLTEIIFQNFGYCSMRYAVFRIRR
uniref:NEDD8 n=1 Tax=Schistocephalus solidus TaxID=70667 RepID=A0A0V0J372_SCHSO